MFAHEMVKVDKAHSELIKGLVMSSKPTSILELGIGGGESTDAILSGLMYNEKTFNYTLVDNWCDWGGKKPEIVEKIYGHLIKIITNNEKDFVFSCNQKFDFIMSDADHNHANEWFEHVYKNLLNEEGILIYHDIAVGIEPNDFKNLLDIYDDVKRLGINHVLLNKNSLPNERCHRGLLVIFKNYK